MEMKWDEYQQLAYGSWRREYISGFVVLMTIYFCVRFRHLISFFMQRAIFKNFGLQIYFLRDCLSLFWILYLISFNQNPPQDMNVEEELAKLQPSQRLLDYYREKVAKFEQETQELENFLRKWVFTGEIISKHWYRYLLIIENVINTDIFEGGNISSCQNHMNYQLLTNFCVSKWIRLFVCMCVMMFWFRYIILFQRRVWLLSLTITPLLLYHRK